MSICLRAVERDHLPHKSYLPEIMMSEFELRQASLDIQLALNKQRRKASIGFAKELKSRRTSFSRSFLLANICSAMNLGKPTKNSPRRFVPPIKKASHSSTPRTWAKNKTWTTLTLDPHRRSFEHCEIRFGDRKNVPGIQRMHVFPEGNNIPGQLAMSYFMRGQ